MIQAAIVGCVFLGIFKFFERNTGREVDYWSAFVLIIVPLLAVFLLALGASFVGLTSLMPIVALVAYFIIPTLLLKFQLDFPWSRSSAYGATILALLFGYELVTLLVLR